MHRCFETKPLHGVHDSMAGRCPAAAALLLCAALCLAGFSGNLAAHDPETDQLYQVSTIDALLAGVYDQAATVGEVLAHGDFGIGTFDGLDGELIALGGTVFQAAIDGSVNVMPVTAGTPFMAVTWFEPDQRFALKGPLDWAAFQLAVARRFPSRNLFYAIYAEGQFEQIRYRSVGRQQPPYRPLAEVARDQVIFEQRNIRGSLIGFWLPDFTKGLNIPGFHLHFLSEDRKHGGHVLGFRLAQAVVELDQTSGWSVRLPEDPAYLEADLERDRSAQLHAVEQAPSGGAQPAQTRPAPTAPERAAPAPARP